MRRVAGLLILLTAVACENGGASRTAGITASGLVTGEVYFDRNGSFTRDAGDVGFAAAGVRLLAPNGRDTLARASTGADGRFRFASVPAGSYLLVVDSASAGDTARVLTAAQAVAVGPSDTLELAVAVAFPTRTVAAVRALAVGTPVFVRALAYHARETFSDTTLGVVDSTGALRATRVLSPGVTLVPGDSVVLRGRVAVRLGQRVLDDVTVFVGGRGNLPAVPAIGSGTAATAGTAGVLDGSLIQLTNALVADTATVAGDLRMTVNDGSGAVVVVLDRASDAGFRAPLPAGLYVPGARFDLVGVLVPVGNGTWRVKPRSALDLTRR